MFLETLELKTHTHTNVLDASLPICLHLRSTKWLLANVIADKCCSMGSVGNRCWKNSSFAEGAIWSLAVEGRWRMPGLGDRTDEHKGPVHPAVSVATSWISLPQTASTWQVSVFIICFSQYTGGRTEVWHWILHL